MGNHSETSHETTTDTEDCTQFCPDPDLSAVPPGYYKTGLVDLVDLVDLADLFLEKDPNG